MHSSSHVRQSLTHCPASERNIGNAHAFSDARPAAISWAAKYLKLFLVPTSNHNSSPDCNACAIDTVNKTTSVSTVQIRILWRSCLAACEVCSSMRLSASSWLYGASNVRSFSGGLLWTRPSVMTSCLSFSSNHLKVICVMNANNSILFSSTRRKLRQFPDVAAAVTTRLRTPLPSFDLAVVFNESSL